MMKKLLYFFLPLLAFVACEDNGVDGLNDKSPLNTLTSVLNFNPNGDAVVETSSAGASVTLKYEVIPAGCAKVLSKQWKNYVTLQALYSNSDEIDFVKMPISEVVADEDNGIITVTASGENLSAEFYSGLVEASCRLVISDSKNELRSDYKKLTCSRWSAETLPSPQSNEIYYTASGVVSSKMNDVVSNVYDYTKGYYIMTFQNPITEIEACAFKGCSSLTSITIPDSVTTIAYSAFEYCRSLTSITIPDSVTTIGYYAFNDCRSLTSVNITDIAAWCSISFDSNPLGYAHNLYLNGKLVTDLVIPDSVTKIGYMAFNGCSSLTSITIPDSVKTIGSYAFAGCSNLTSVTIPDGVTKIWTYTFSGCSSLTSVTIGDSVTEIGDYAFEDCSSLTSVTIPDSVTAIRSWAFYDCSSLTSITIPDSVTTIGNYAFYGCGSLTRVNIKISNLAKYCAGNCMYNIPGVHHLFIGGTEITKLTIPDSVTEIEHYAFYDCSSLTSVTIGNSVYYIGKEAFYGCSSLTSVTIGDSVTTIGQGAFLGCSSLTSITIGYSVTAIRSWAFDDCSSLKTVYCKATTPPENDGLFDYASSVTIYVPRASVEKYRNTYPWSRYNITGYDF